MEYQEIKPIIKANQRYTKRTSRTAYLLMLKHLQEDRLSPKQVELSATHKRRQALTASCALAANESLYSALIAGAVYDQKLEKWMRHKDLINHPDPETRKLWPGGGEKEFGSLCQGYNETKGKDVLRFI